MGRLVPEHELADCVDAWLNDLPYLTQLHHRAWAMGRRDGAAGVAQTALEFARTSDLDVAAAEGAS